MKLLLTGVGTRGDMEPLLAIGQGLEPELIGICVCPELFSMK